MTWTNKTSKILNADTDWNRQKKWLFFKYVLSEPFRQVYILLRATPKKIYNPKAWTYIFIVSMILSIIKGDKWGALISFVMWVLFALIKEYESGEYIHYYRQKNKNKFKKDLDKSSQKD